MPQSKNSRIQKMWNDLPYGKYVFEDGSQILFNRKYELFINGEPVKPNKEMELKIQGAKSLWFYKDSNPPWENQEILSKCQNIQEVFGAL